LLVAQKPPGDAGRLHACPRQYPFLVAWLHTAYPYHDFWGAGQPPISSGEHRRASQTRSALRPGWRFILSRYPRDGPAHPTDEVSDLVLVHLRRDEQG
jgi:hypothetical protein